MSYSISAASGCNITSLTLNSVSQTITNSSTMAYLLSNITSDKTVSSTCTCPTIYTITSSTTGCTMSPLGTINVTSGGNVTFSISASSNCNITQI